MDDYANDERKCTKIREEKTHVLQDFAAWLRQSQLSAKTIQRHLDNVDLYLNEFLLYEDALTAKDGVLYIGEFLGYWFIRKAMWARVAQIKQNAASLKKFYPFMHQQGQIGHNDLDELKTIIKEDMPEWMATMQRYDDPTVTDMGEMWGLPRYDVE